MVRGFGLRFLESHFASQKGKKNMGLAIRFLNLSWAAGRSLGKLMVCGPTP